MRKIKLRNAPRVKSDKNQDSNPGCIAFKVSVSPDQQLKDQKSPSNQLKEGSQMKPGDSGDEELKPGDRLWAIQLWLYFKGKWIF